MQVLLYIFILCAIASSAQEMHLFDMIESHGALLKIIEVVPHAIWCLAETGIMIAVFIMTKKRISHIASRYNSLWIALLVLCGVAGIFDIIDYGKEESFITLLGTLIVLAMIVVMAVLGYKIARNYDGKIRTIGNVFTYAPGVCLIIGLLIMAMLPDSFGELDTRTYDYGGAYIRYEQSFNTSTIVLTIVMVIVSALMEIIPVAACTEYIRTTGASDDDLSSNDEPDNISETEAKPDMAVGTEAVASPSPDISEEKVCNFDDVTEEEPSKSRKKKFAIIFSIVLAVIAGVAIWVYTKSDDKVGNNNIAAEAIYENGRKIIFTSDHKVKFMDEGENEEDVCASSEGRWWMDGGVLVCFTGEGTSHFSIIDGYEYQGEYRSEDGMCYNEEWVGDQETGGLDDVGYYPTPSKGTKLKSFKWFTDIEKTLKETASQDYPVQSHKLDVIAHNGTTEPLPPHKDTTYEADRLVDGNPSTAWAMRFEPSENTQSPIWGPIIEFKENGKIDYVVIYNGYGKSNGLYEKNSRPAWITIYRPIAPDTGEPESKDILYDGPLKDTMEPQKLAVNKEFDYSRSISELTIKLPRYSEDNYYRGTTYDDLVISEIEFWGH